MPRFKPGDRVLQRRNIIPPVASQVKDDEFLVIYAGEQTTDTRGRKDKPLDGAGKRSDKLNASNDD